MVVAAGSGPPGGEAGGGLAAAFAGFRGQAPGGAALVVFLPGGPGGQTRRKNGKTATRILSDEQLADYGPWFDNHRRLRELIAELEELSLAVTEADPRWNREPDRPPSPAEPEQQPPENVVSARLTCGQPSTQPRFPSSGLNVKTSPQVERLTGSPPVAGARA